MPQLILNKNNYYIILLYMNRIIYILIGLFIINTMFGIIPYLMPRAPSSILLPYQLWFNVIFIFTLILPTSVGHFDILYK
jgi:hypothetical protein